jgi:hypothetical protein
MRRHLALAGLAVGLAVTVLPIAGASANCDPDTGLGDGGCTNGCMQAGERYEALRAKVGGDELPSYWDVFNCPQ